MSGAGARAAGVDVLAIVASCGKIVSTVKAWRFCLLGTTAPQLNINCGQRLACEKRHALTGNDAAHERVFVVMGRDIMTKELKLSKGMVTIVDDDDYPRLSRHKWSCSSNGYAVRQRLGRLIYMHREIMDAPKSLHVDHINGNSLDNRKSNLRLCTHAQNMRNSSVQSNNDTGYKGVRKPRGRNKYRATIVVNNEKIHLGYFDNPKDAARAYNKAAKKYHGKFAKLNSL